MRIAQAGATGFRKRHAVIAMAIGLALCSGPSRANAADESLQLKVGAAKADITPELREGHPVWMAGHELNRPAEGIHDPLFARALVLRDGQRSIALVAVDLIGVQHPLVRRVREQLPEFAHVLVASTHTHEGPDCVGIWGPAPDRSGVDPQYLEKVAQGIVRAVREAASRTAPAEAVYGTAEDVTLLADYRLPNVFDPVLRTVRFHRPGKRDETLAVLVQWNSHPIEPDKNRLITRDCYGYTVDRLEAEFAAPVVYFDGAIGGLMGTPNKRFQDAQGNWLAKDAFDLMRMYGHAVADLTIQALEEAKPVCMVPLVVSSREIALRLDNAGFRAARRAGVLPRPAFRWTGDVDRLGEPVAPDSDYQGPVALRSEVTYLRLGELHLAGIPGELYPELVYGEFQDPADPGADFPDAPLEPCVASLLPDDDKMLLIGLANDEVGYIVPKRQWDVKPPYAYGRDSPQYGERNSVGPETAALIMEALRRRVAEAQQASTASAK